MRIRSVLAPVILLVLCFSAALFAGEQLRLGSCAQCKTVVTEENRKFAVIVPKGIEYSVFDDIGCAVIGRSNECASRQTLYDNNAVTYDHLTGEEVPVDQAFFIYRTDVKTPRGYGIVAFKDKAKAEEFAAAHGKGKVIKWYLLVDEKMAP
jgi:hypothetical protein